MQTQTQTQTLGLVIDEQPAVARPVAIPQQSAVASINPAQLLQIAINQNADLDRLQKLMDMQLQWEANEARKAFTQAMVEFKQHPPEIIKDKLVAFSGTEYMHATIGNVCDKVIAALAKVGISHKWEPTQSGADITVTCVLTHRLGHSERTTMSSMADNSGKKNGIQSIASTTTYLSRYSLLMACGLATKDQEDDDGRGAEPEGSWAGQYLDMIAKANTSTEVEAIWRAAADECRKKADKVAHLGIKTAVIARNASIKKSAEESANKGENQ